MVMNLKTRYVFALFLITAQVLTACASAATEAEPPPESATPAVVETIEVATVVIEMTETDEVPPPDGTPAPPPQAWSSVPAGSYDGFCPELVGIGGYNLPNPINPVFTANGDRITPPYRDGVVIVSGVSTDIQIVLDASGLGLEAEEFIAEANPNTADSAQEVSRLYDYTTVQPVPGIVILSVWDVIQLIVQTAIDQNLMVSADPDYLVNNPNGNPWRGEGSPWRGEGSADGATAMPGVTAAGEIEFWRQWSLGSAYGIGIFSDEPFQRRDYDRETGKFVLFDSSPFSASGMYTFPFDYYEDLNLCVVNASDSHVNDHGLYAAGLIHSVAPGSEITLIRVLNGDLGGDMFTLLQGLAQYLDASIRAERLPGTVINLSLGLHPEESVPSDDLGVPEIEAERTSWENYVASISGFVSLFPELEPYQNRDDLPVFALGLMLAFAQEQGAWIVAAAGNDLGAAPQIPAAFDFVIDVGATGMNAAPACYSNTASYYAPGANGDKGCGQAWAGCGGVNCEHGVISLVTIPAAGGSDFGFAYWAGTSFAAPLVSGLVGALEGIDPVLAHFSVGELPSVIHTP